VGDPRALFLPDQVEARVDARGRARAGDHRVVVDVENVGIDLGRRVAAGQFGGAPPVRGAAAAVQQAGLAQDEGAGADAQHPVAPEHLADGAELEREEAVDDHHGNVAQHDPSMPNGLAGCHPTMALLPLAGNRPAGHAEHMDAYSTSAAGQRTSWIVRFTRQASYVFSEINWANKRMTALRLSYGVAEPDRAPDT